MKADGAEAFVKMTDRVFAAVASTEVSRDACMLYLVMLRHVNRKRGDAVIWPSRNTLATAMGLQKVQSVDKYIRELAVAGWIDVQRRQESRTKTRNRYVIRGPSMEIVPSTGPSSAAEIVPSRGPSIVPSTGTEIVPSTGLELEEPQPDELEPSLRRRSSSSATGGRRKTIAKSKDQQKTDDLRKAVELISYWSGVSEEFAEDVATYWHHIGDKKFPGMYAQAIIDQDCEERLAEVAEEVLAQSPGEFAGEVMLHLPLIDGLDEEEVEKWIAYAADNNAPWRHIMTALFGLANRGVPDTAAYVNAVQELMPVRAA